MPEEYCHTKATPAYNWNNLFTTRAPQKQTYNALKYRVINHQSTTQLSFKILLFLPLNHANHTVVLMLNTSEVLSYPTQLSAMIPPQPQSAPRVWSFNWCWTFPIGSQGLCSGSGNHLAKIRPRSTKSLSCCRPIWRSFEGYLHQTWEVLRTHVTPFCRGEFHAWVLHIVGSGLTPLVIKWTCLMNKKK